MNAQAPPLRECCTSATLIASVEARTPMLSGWHSAQRSGRSSPRSTDVNASVMMRLCHSGSKASADHVGSSREVERLPAVVLSGSLGARSVARQWAPGRDWALVAGKELPAARQAAGSRVVSGCEPVPDWGFRASVAGCSDRSVDLDPAFERLISNGYLLWTSSRIAERRALAELYSRAESACDHS